MVQSECPICLEKFSNTVEVAAMRCGHLYHDECLFTKTVMEKGEDLVARIDDCAICRAEITITGSAVLKGGHVYERQWRQELPDSDSDTEYYVPTDRGE